MAKLMVVYEQMYLQLQQSSRFPAETNDLEAWRLPVFHATR